VKLCPTCQGEYPDEVEFCAKDGASLVPRGEPQAGTDPLVGTVLGGKLRIERKVAEGGMGRIYEARHVRLGRRLAVKVLNDQFTQNEQAVLRFQREAQTAASLDNPNIVEIIDIDRTDDGQFYIVMEYLEGEELRETIRRDGVLALDRVVRIFRQVGRALEAAHGQGIVHRDLKPENIFIVHRDNEEIVKVVDFGISKIRSGDAKLTQTGAVIGTPYYMAPEQAKGDTSLDHRADVYALGAILYELSTGKLPAVAETPTGILMKILLEDPTPPRMVNPAIPEAVEAVIIRAMAKTPADRFDSVAEFVDALAAAAAGAAMPQGVPATAPHAVAPTMAAPGGVPGLGAAASAMQQQGAAPAVLAPTTGPAAGPLPGATETAAGPSAAWTGAAQPAQPEATPAPGGVAMAAPDPTGVAMSTPAAPMATPDVGRMTVAPSGGGSSMRWAVVAGVVLGCLVLGGTITGVLLTRGDDNETPTTTVDPTTPPTDPAVGANLGAGTLPTKTTPADGGALATTPSVRVLFTSDPAGAEVVRGDQVMCSPTPCTATFPANTPGITVAMRAEGRRDAELSFDTTTTDLSLSSELPEDRRSDRGDRGGSTGSGGATKTGGGGEDGTDETSPGFASSPFSGKAPPGGPTKTGPTVVGNPFE